MSRSEYDYLSAAGDYVFTVVVERGAAGVKKAWQGIRNGDGSIAPGLNGLPRPPLYRLPELIAHIGADRRDPIYVVEGEKDVEALRELGCTATTNPMGAGKWRPWHTDVLIGARRVIVVADADEPGRDHARVVHRELRRVIGSSDVELLTTPADLGEHADVSDLLAAGRNLDELVPLSPAALPEPDAGDEPVRIVLLDTFADTPEEGADPVLGTNYNVLLGADSDGMFYGDGGAGKTTLTIDLGLHLAAGDDWLGIAVAHPLRVLFIENEGPRPLFRAKLRRKRDAWAGSDLGDRVLVWEEPWGRFTYASEACREALGEAIREREVDVVICGPLVSAGMEAAGTLQDVRAFLMLVGFVRDLAGRPFLNLLVHHENKGGKVSGAWEGAGDTLLHVSAQGRGRVRLHVQKARWAPESHGTTLQLLWADGDSFEVEEEPELTDEMIAEQIVAFIGDNPGTGWTGIKQATKGVRDDRRRAVRDGLLAAGKIVNVVKDKGVETALAEVPARRPTRFHLADDPTIKHLEPDPAPVGLQSGAAGEEGTRQQLEPGARPIGAPGGLQLQSLLPPDENDQAIAAAAPEPDAQDSGGGQGGER